jgi:CubicO group peptidase (beta-lactamase class C family)
MKNVIFLIGKFHRSILFLILISANLAVMGQGLPPTIPEQVGLSSERLNRIETVIKDNIAKGIIPGGVFMVGRHGKVAYFKAFGMMDVESNKEMSKEAMFRVASMSKCITSVAVMILYEEGNFLLEDPVSKYIPEFSNPKVIVKSPTNDSISLVAAKSEITIRQLLNHTSGITYGEGLQRSFYKKAGIESGLSRMDGTIGDMVKKLASLPLICNPGEEFHYSLSVDVLGYLVEVISKMPLDEFLRKRIFEPLKMNDTYFSLPENKYTRLAGLYKLDQNGKMTKANGYMDYTTPQKYYSGGAGLISTTADYARFAQMLLNYGELDGKHILGRKTVEIMTTNSIGDKYVFTVNKHFGIIADKFGLGFGIRTERGVYDELESIGSYGWDGAFYTKFWMDPREDLFGIFMTQMSSDDNLISKYKVLVYQSIIGK